MKLVGPSLHVGELQRICLPVTINNFSLHWYVHQGSHINLNIWQSFVLDHLLTSGGRLDC